MRAFAFDTETWLIEEHCKAPPMVCLSYADERYASGAPGLCGLLHRTEAASFIENDMLRNQDRILVGANVAYDMGVLAQAYPHLVPLIWEAYFRDRVDDVQIRQRLIDIAQGKYWELRQKKGSYSLAGLVKRYFGEELEKDEWRLRYKEFHNVPVKHWPAGAQKYPVDDAIATLRVYQAQQEYLPVLADSYRQVRAAYWIHLMTSWGISTDQKRVRKLYEETSREYKILEEKLLSEGLMKRVGKMVVKIQRDTKAAKARMVDAVGEDKAKRTEKGEISLDKESCENSGDEGLEAYAELTHLKTLLSKEIPALKPIIHSSFEVLMETGRTSSRGPNIQNPSRKGGVRECYVPRPGYVFVDSDYDIIELRTFAQVCLYQVGYSKLADKLNAGFDPHLDLGAQILGISYQDALANKKSPEVKEARQMAKSANFGYPGGMGAKTFAAWVKANYGMEMSLGDATMLRDKWFENWPEAREYFQKVSDKKYWYPDLDRGEDVRDIQQLFSGRIRGGCLYTEACNGYFQGLAADIGKNAGFLIGRACYDESQESVLFGSRIVNFIHDQFIVEVPEEIGHECAMEVGRLMRLGAADFVPDVPATCTPCLASCWSKEAEAVYDANGRLIPWTPST